MKNRKANRLAHFDYRSDNVYFVTVCTKKWVHFFGEIVDGDMQCNEVGTIAQQQWEWLQMRYPYIQGHGFVVMPNHVHVVLEICHDLNSMQKKNLRSGHIGSDYVGSNQVRTGRDLSLQPSTENLQADRNLSSQNLLVPKSPNQQYKIKSLSELIGAYKTTTSKRIHQLGYDSFSWHRSFHDHIIRSEKSYTYIMDYVATNPQRWQEDKFYAE